MTACGIDLAREAQLHQVDVWTSHEGLVLDYEEGLTRRDSLTGDWYDCSAHMLWIGERTRQPDGAHAAFFAGVHNPLGVKVGPTASPRELVELCAQARSAAHARAPDADRPHGRRAGARGAAAAAARRARRRGTPSCGRAIRCTPTASAPRPASRHAASTRSWTSSRASSRACRSEGTWPGGVHLEFTGEDVTECLGGAEAVLEEQLETRYMSLCDPRLNARQSLDLAFRLAELMRGDARPA